MLRIIRERFHIVMILCTSGYYIDANIIDSLDRLTEEGCDYYDVPSVIIALMLVAI